MRYDPEAKPGVSNLLDIIAVVEGSDPVDVATRFTSYGALKAACTDAVVGVLEPIQQRYAELRADEGELRRALAVGAARALETSAPVLVRARTAMGLVAPGG